MTLNQIVKRVQTICLAHKQVRSFDKGVDITEFLNDKTTKYAATYMLMSTGGISTSGHALTVNCRIYFLDLVNVSEDTRTNTLDVQSDMISVAMDILAQMNNPNYEDWAISGDNQINLQEGEFSDIVAGCYVDISIRFMYPQDVCQIPTTLIDYTTTDTDMKVYDLIYDADGTEGSTLTIAGLAGKKILLVTRENNILYRASNLPGSTEYTFNGTDAGLGTPVNVVGERFLFLYRNY